MEAEFISYEFISHDWMTVFFMKEPGIQSKRYS